MAYSVRVQRMGDAGTPKEDVVSYEVETEIEAMMIAAARVKTTGAQLQRVATIRDASNRIILTYSGCTNERYSKDRRSVGK